LHTCWCIVFECLNSNLGLNSIDWVFSKLETLFLLTLYPYPYLARVGLGPSLAKFARAPSAFPVGRFTSPPPSPRSPPAARSAQHFPMAQRGLVSGLLARRRRQSLTRGPHISSAASHRRRSNPHRDRAGGRVLLGVRVPAAFSLGPASHEGRTLI
jgi:hypothetical protein